MQNPRYYRLAPALLSLLFAGRVATAAQSPAPAPPEAKVACDELKHDPLPAWTDSPDHSKRLTDCGYEFRHDGDNARADESSPSPWAWRNARRSIGGGDGAGRHGAPSQLGRPDPRAAASAGFRDQRGLGDARHGQAPPSWAICGRCGRATTRRGLHLRASRCGRRSATARHSVALNNVGGTYQSVGDYVSAADYFQRSLTGLENSATSVAAPRDRQSRAYFVLGDYPKGLAVTARLRIRRGLHDKDGIARSLTSMS